MGQFIENIRYRIKTSSGSLLLLTYKTFVGFMMGLTFGLIGQQMTGYGTFAFLFVILVTTVVFYRISRAWRWTPILVFSLICVLLALLLRMYILIAPGA